MQSPEREWPPRNAREALLSSPNGRRKFEERRTRRGGSPSPLKQTSPIPTRRSRLSPTDTRQSEDEDQEDEETLQLQLQAIEAKLKLKKLQNKKTKAQASDSNTENEEPIGRAASRSQSALSSRRTNTTLSQSKSTTDVQIPLSPERRVIQPGPPRSPGRVLLGIDKGLNAKHVSLKRAPSEKRLQVALSDPFQDSRDVGIGRSKSLNSGRRPPGVENKGGKSFSERISEARERNKKDQERHARREQLRSNRTAGFGVREEELRAFEKTAVEETSRSESTQVGDRAFTREEVLKGLSARDGSTVRRSNSIGTRRPNPITSCLKKSSVDTNQPEDTDEQARSETGQISEEVNQVSDKGDPALFEPFSSCNLSRRVLPHSFIKRTVDAKTPVKIPDLLKDVKAPEFSVSEELLESDFVLFAIVGSKSDPIAHKQNVRTDTKEHTLTAGMEADRSERNDNGNFLIITLTDLKWTLELFLFGTAYTRFRKLTPGTVVAILNPDIMPPQRHKVDTGRFSLKLSSSEDTLLEIGTSRDIGWCSANKKDGKPCGAWIDKRLTSVCEFHSSISIDKIRSGRMEVQGMSAPFGPGGRNGSWSKSGGGNRAGGGGQWGGRGGSRTGGRPKADDRGPQYDREAQSTYFYVKGQQSAAALLDADDHLRRGDGSKERQRQELARIEKERKIAEGLGMRGNGAGAEYLRHRGRAAPTPTAELSGTEMANGVDKPEARNAASLGLVSGKGRDVMLSPLKRKMSGQGGGAVKKKTRFVTPRGIREAGRDSLGMESLPGGKLGDLDDDDLDIV